MRIIITDTDTISHHFWGCMDNCPTKWVTVALVGLCKTRNRKHANMQLNSIHRCWSIVWSLLRRYSCLSEILLNLLLIVPSTSRRVCIFLLYRIAASFPETHMCCSKKTFVLATFPRLFSHSYWLSVSADNVFATVLIFAPAYRHAHRTNRLWAGKWTVSGSDKDFAGDSCAGGPALATAIHLSSGPSFTSGRRQAEAEMSR